MHEFIGTFLDILGNLLDPIRVIGSLLSSLGLFSGGLLSGLSLFSGTSSKLRLDEVRSLNSLLADTGVTLDKVLVALGHVQRHGVTKLLSKGFHV